MYDFLTHLFDSSGFPARWQCGNWTPGHGWLHILSDLGVWSAYLAIPCVLGFLVLRRQDIPFRSTLLLFGAFILACGTTHLMEAIIFWWPLLPARRVNQVLHGNRFLGHGHRLDTRRTQGAGHAQPRGAGA